MLGGTSLAPTGPAPVAGQFDDASPAGGGGTSITTYDEFGRPRLAGSGGGSSVGRGGVNGEGSRNGSSASGGRDGGGGEREGRGGNRTGDDKGRDRDRDRCVIYVCALCVLALVGGKKVCIACRIRGF